MPRIGVITFSESREEYLKKRQPLVEFELARVTRALNAQLELVLPEPVRVREGAGAAAKLCESRSCDAVILHIPIFTEPTLVVDAALRMQVPVLLLGNLRPDTSSLVGLLAAGGALDQVGRLHRRLMIGAGESWDHGPVVAFANAARARSRLRGQIFGRFGGCSLGMLTADADPVQWHKVFGISTVQLDQALIVDEARRADSLLVAETYEWLVSHVARVEFDGNTFTSESLERQVRSYLGTRKIAEMMDVDFLSVKCQTELSDHYALQCVSHSLLNDPYDAQGPKKPIVSSCEADADGALTMQILSLLGGGVPVSTHDIRCYDPKSNLVTLANCGGTPTFFASFSHDPAENLRMVSLLPHVFGKAGGAATQFVCGATPVTLARLCRLKGKLWMGIIAGGRFVSRGLEKLRETTWCWPHAFFSPTDSFDFQSFLEHFSSNHIHAVQGDVSSTLVEFCLQVNIPYRRF